jgi:hypothetical protein
MTGERRRRRSDGSAGTGPGLRKNCTNLPVVYGHTVALRDIAEAELACCDVGIARAAAAHVYASINASSAVARGKQSVQHLSHTASSASGQVGGNE